MRKLSKIYLPPTPVSIEEPVIAGQQVAWMESAGSSTWRVKTLHLGDPAPMTIANFQAPTDRAGVIRIDGSRLAYVMPGASGHGDTIHLAMARPPFRTLQTIHIPEAVFRLGLGGTNLFWVQGKVTAPPQLSIYDTSAWIATDTDPAPHRVADGAFESGFDGSWMTWVRDPSQDGTDDQILAMRVGQTAATVLTPEPGPNTPGGLYSAVWPSVGDGIVAWSIDGPQDYSLAVWPIGASTPVGVEATSLRSVAIAGTSIGSGWLVWNEGQAIGGAKVSDILGAITAAGIH